MPENLKFDIGTGNADSALRIIMDASPVGIVAFDHDARVLFANPPALRLFGKTFLSAGMRCGDFIGCKKRHEAPNGCGHTQSCPACPLSRAICAACSDPPDTAVMEGETFLEREPTPSIWVKYKTVEIRLNDRNAVVMSIDDITDQKMAEEKLESALAELSVIHEHAPIAMMLLDRDRRVRKLNGFADRFADRPAAQMIGLRGGEALRCLHHIDDPRGCGFGPACNQCRIRQAVLDTFETGTSQAEIEAWLPFPRGKTAEERCLLISTAYLRVDGTERVLVCVQDITERKLSEIALKESEAKFRLTFDASPDAINVNRLENGVYVDINEGFTRLTGFTREDVIGKSSIDINIWHHLGDRQKLVQGLREKGFYENLEAKFCRKDGSITTALMSARVISIKNEPHIISITRDISEQIQSRIQQQKLEDQLHQAQKLESVGRLAGGVAHDFNNLLSVILGYSELVLEDVRGDHPHRKVFTQIHEAAIRARDLTRQLLAFSRKQILDVTSVDINRVVTGFEALLRRVLGEDVKLELALATQPLSVKADTAQLEQVLMNLAVNARDAMPDGGILSIETAAVTLDDAYVSNRSDAAPGDYAMIGVSDTGCGMDKETLELIFEPFFTTKDKDKGTGLGLSTSYGIVKQHGGTIFVDSEPGRGTTFKIYLPFGSGPAAAKPKKPQAAQMVSSGATILIVEDDPSVRQLAVSILKRGGYQVIESDSAMDAVEKSARYGGSIHLMLTDVVMPGLNGPELFARMNEHHPEAKVLYMSGYTDNVIARQGVLKDGIEFIQKPFSVHGLFNKVSAVLKNF